MITEVLGRKIGMTQIFTENGTVQSVTVIEAGPCTVTQVKTTAKEGYSAVQMGFVEAKRLNSPERGHLGNLGLFKHLTETRLDDTSDIELGHKVGVEMFQPGDLVAISGVSKGKGFAGTIKRHNFSGGPKTHGQSDRHRAPGSIGAGTSPGRVFKGQRMAGHMGHEQVTVKNLKVMQVDSDRNLLLVRGSVPGARNGLLKIRKCKACD